MSAEHHNKDFQKAALAARGRVADSPTTVNTVRLSAKQY